MRRHLNVVALMLLTVLAPALAERGDAAEPGKRFQALGHKIEVKLDSAATNGAYSVLEFADQPGMGPPRHVHAAEDEIFHVVQGQIRFWRGNEVFEAGPGAVVYMPRNVPHTYQNVGKTQSRVLVVITPGRLQGFFEEAARRNITMPRDAEVFAELAGRYAIKVLGPPPGSAAAKR